MSFPHTVAWAFDQSGTRMQWWSHAGPVDSFSHLSGAWRLADGEVRHIGVDMTVRTLLDLFYCATKVYQHFLPHREHPNKHSLVTLSTLQPHVSLFFRIPSRRSRICLHWIYPTTTNWTETARLEGSLRNIHSTVHFHVDSLEMFRLTNGLAISAKGDYSLTVNS